MSQDFWEENASAWAEVIQGNTIASRAVTSGALLKIISDKNIKSILDVGCGEGWLAGQLSPSTVYLGIDGSANLIAIAKENHPSAFYCVSYSEISAGTWTASDKYDAAIFNFSLLDEKITQLLVNIQNSVSDNGLVIIQTLHPCFILESYKDGWNTEDYKAMAVPFSGTMPWYGRKLSSWMKCFSDAGLTLKEIVEPQTGDKPSSIIFILQK
jgi:hypothetical protein